MLSRKSTYILAQLCENLFTNSRNQFERRKFYQFLFVNEYPDELLEASKIIGDRYYEIRNVSDFIMNLNTGRTLGRLGYSPNEIEIASQRKILVQLAEDILVLKSGIDDSAETQNKTDVQELAESLIAHLELDGYQYKDQQLFVIEESSFNLEELEGLIESLYKSCGLKKLKLAKQYLCDMTEHYSQGKWDDSVAEARRLFELTLQESSSKYYLITKEEKIPNDIYSNAKKARRYLMKNRLISEVEKDVIDKLYRLLSETGGHPYMTQKDQARLMRQLSLSIVEFVLRRLEGFLAKE